MNQLETFSEIVMYCNGKYERSKIPYENLFWRTAREIKESREIHYLCCTERTLVVSQCALQEGLENRLILFRVKRPLQPIKFGAALEINLDGVDYRFVSGNSGDVLAQGQYVESRKFAYIHRAITKLDDLLNFFNHFGIHSVEELEREIPGLNFYKFVDRIRKKSTNRHFKRKQQKVKNNKNRKEEGRIYF